MRNTRTSSLTNSNLEDLTSHELIDLFICAAKEFEQGMLADAETVELNALQARIATIKDHIFRKSNVTPEGSISDGYFYTSFINKN